MNETNEQTKKKLMLQSRIEYIFIYRHINQLLNA